MEQLLKHERQMASALSLQLMLVQFVVLAEMLYWIVSNDM